MQHQVADRSTRATTARNDTWNETEIWSAKFWIPKHDIAMYGVFTYKNGKLWGDVSIDTHIYGVFAYIHLMCFFGPNSDKPKTS